MTPESDRNLRTAVFLDRDGTINRNYSEGPVYQASLFQLLPRSAEAIRMLNDANLRVYIVTNQGGISHKDRDFTWEEYYRIEKLMRDCLAAEAGAHIDDVFICHHADYEECSCRKPEVGLLKQAQEKYGFSPSESYIVGDSSADIIAGSRFGLNTILVESGWRTGVAGELRDRGVEPGVVLKDLWEAARYIIDDVNRRGKTGASQAN